MNEATDFEKRFPSIPWRTPLTVYRSGVMRLCCRFCIAKFGLKASELETVGFKTEEDLTKHLNEAHHT